MKTISNRAATEAAALVDMIVTTQIIIISDEKNDECTHSTWTEQLARFESYFTSSQSTLSRLN